MMRLVNLGLSVFNWAEKQSNSNQIVYLILVQFPLLQAKFVKYVILFPIYEIAKAIWGDNIFGAVEKEVNYYANYAEWYIDSLLSKPLTKMTDRELFDLSYIYSELSDLKR